MPLEPGTRLGPYEVTAAVGKGGMGEVYRARDTTLNRDVAIKVLPEALAGDTDRLARFQREAEALAALNHPNIAQIYGVEHFAPTRTEGVVPPSGGEEVRPPRQALVLEYVEGPTLADRIATGPVPLDQALPVARQIADALEAAHQRGIIHRDLKPANIKVREDGTVKLLDFGLAKALAPDPISTDGAELANSPTLTARATQMGMILGTAAYMAPEQAKGKDVDKRADVWAFGVVLFEMLSGQRPFDGDDVSEVMARVIDRKPDWTALPAGLPPPVLRLLRRCLVKLPQGRLRDIGDARLEIDDAAGAPDPASGRDAGTGEPATWRQVLPTSAAALVAGGLLVGLVAWPRWTTTEPAGVTRFEHRAVDLVSGLFRTSGLVAVSPDGRRMVYATTDGLLLRSMDDPEARLISGTEAGQSPLFSPDGQLVAFVQEGQIKTVPVAGGSPDVISPAGRPLGMSWTTDGTILFVGPEGVMSVPDTGGRPEVVVASAEGEQMAAPQLLPDRDTLLVTVSASGWESSDVVAVSLATGARTRLVEGGAAARYLPTGHLVYTDADELLARTFDTRRLTVGEPVALVQGVAGTWTGGIFATSDAGTLVYAVGQDAEERQMVWVDRDGREEPLPAPARAYLEPTVSPDGTRVAVTIEEGDSSNIWVWDVGRETLTPLDLDPARDMWPQWTPDGTAVVFLSRRDGGGLFRKAADGTGEVGQVLASPGSPGPYTWAADGRLVVSLPKSAGNFARDILAVSLSDPGAVETLLDEPYHEQRPAISPNGRWLAYGSSESSRNEIFLRPFPDVDRRRIQVSTDGGRMPLWSATGRELYYLTDDHLMAVPITDTAPDPVGRPASLFRSDDYLAGGAFRHYSVAPDGRFLFLRHAAGAAGAGRREPTLMVVQNWFEELTSRVRVR